MSVKLKYSVRRVLAEFPKIYRVEHKMILTIRIRSNNVTA